MPQRIAAVEAAKTACREANAAADVIDDLLRRFRAGETISALHDEIDAATAAMLLAAEQIRAAVHEYQMVDRRLTGGL